MIKFRVKIYKVKNSLIIYIYTEKIDLKIYLYSRKVSGINLFNYDYVEFKCLKEMRNVYVKVFKL